MIGGIVANRGGIVANRGGIVADGGIRLRLPVRLTTSVKGEDFSGFINARFNDLELKMDRMDTKIDTPPR